jgi:hypothetical protein
MLYRSESPKHSKKKMPAKDKKKGKERHKQRRSSSSSADSSSSSVLSDSSDSSRWIYYFHSCGLPLHRAIIYSLLSCHNLSSCIRVSQKMSTMYFFNFVLLFALILWVQLQAWTPCITVKQFRPSVVNCYVIIAVSTWPLPFPYEPKNNSMQWSDFCGLKVYKPHKSIKDFWHNIGTVLCCTRE